MSITDGVLFDGVKKWHERAGDEHRRLSLKNFSFEMDSRGKEYLLYSEEVSKTYYGSLKHRKFSPRRCIMQMLSVKKDV